MVRARDGSVLGTVGETGATELALDPVAHRLFITDGESRITVVDTESIKRLKTVDIKEPTGIITDPGQHVVYVGRGRRGIVDVFDGNLRKIDEIATNLPESASGIGLLLDSRTRTLVCVSNPEPNAAGTGVTTVAAVSLESHKVLMTKKLNVGGSVAVDADRDRLIVADYLGTSQKVEALNSKTLDVVVNRVLEFVPGSLALDTSGAYIYLTDAGSPSRVSALSELTLETVGTLDATDTEVGVIDLSVDSVNGYLFMLLGDSPNRMIIAQ